MARKPPTVWPLEEHTRAKHTILRTYLDAWLPIMGMRWNSRLVLIDAFAGPGVYAGEEPGSPIIMLNAFLEHTLRETIKAELVFVFIDEDADRVQKLQEQIALLGKLPEQVKVQVINGRYEEEFAGLLDSVESQGAELAPTFAFIDPFGYSDAPMTLTGRFLQFERCEVLIYVPIPDVNRFIEREGQDRALNSLYGGSDWKHAKALRGRERMNFLHDLFKTKLENECKHVRSFQIVGKHSARGYHLFFGTRHKRGLEKMKEAMWKAAPLSGARFEDSTDPNALVLFGSEVDTGPLVAALRDKFGTKPFGIENALDFTLVHTPYLPTHVKTRTLRPLERLGELEVISASSARRRGQYPDGTRLRFTK